MMECPGRLALCGVPCGCHGRNPSHYPQETETVVTSECFDELVAELNRPAKPNAKMMELLRRTRGSIEHR